MQIEYYIFKQKLLHYLRFESKFFSFVLSLTYFVTFLFLFLISKKKALYQLGNMFRKTQFGLIRKLTTYLLIRIINKFGQNIVGNYFSVEVHASKLEPLIKSFYIKKKPFRNRLIIVSPPTKNQKGVLLIKYNNYFIYFEKIFDLNKLYQRYIIILEPSFSGYFSPSILVFLKYDIPIIIQAYENEDYQFLKNLNTNLIPVKVGANFWVNPSIFFPKKIKKKFDIIMVAIWADFKRHYRLFEAIKKSKYKKSLNICLVGKPYPHSKDHIKNLSKFYNVFNNLTFYENIHQQELNDLYNQSKVCLLLSKKEGLNKSIIEAMYANTPSFILKGFNYGQKYEYINYKTGGFINDKQLHIFLDTIKHNFLTTEYNPNEWIKKNVSYHVGTQKLIEALNNIEKKHKIFINKQLEYKVNDPECNYLYNNLWNKYSLLYKNLINYLKDEYTE